MPASSKIRISSRRVGRCTTIPAPRTIGFPSRRHPEGRRRKTCFLPLTTIVCPALAPPEALATISKCSARRSTIFPFPSSPHCAPMMALTTPSSWRSFFIVQRKYIIPVIYVPSLFHPKLSEEAHWIHHPRSAACDGNYQHNYDRDAHDRYSPVLPRKNPQATTLDPCG